MRLRRLFVLLLGGGWRLPRCATQAPRYYAGAAAPRRAPTSTPWPMARRMYAAPTPPASRPRSGRWRRSWRRSSPYTLDAGDRLRIVVFGQDALSNSYIVDAAGSDRDAADRRGPGARADHHAACRRHRRPAAAAASSAIRAWRSRSRPTGRSSCSARSPIPGNTPTCPNMTVESAVAIAGGFTPRALRRTKSRSPAGLPGAPARLALPLHYPLRPGDTVTVARALVLISFRLS